MNCSPGLGKYVIVVYWDPLDTCQALISQKFGRLRGARHRRRLANFLQIHACFTAGYVIC